ncbi:MAG: hypothetical protein ACRD3D_10280 [Terriglobia bacterium]
MNSSYQPQRALDAARGALIEAMFGAGWLGWGLGEAKAFTGLVGPAFGSLELLLVGCSIYAIREGRRLRRQSPLVPASTRKSFLVVVLWEVLALALVSILAWRLHRWDLGSDWCAMVVGLHFLPLARVFRAPRLAVIGFVMTLWCVLCLVLFRSNTLVVSVTLGTGTLLWIGCVSALHRARRIRQSLKSLPGAASPGMYIQ